MAPARAPVREFNIIDGTGRHETFQRPSTAARMGCDTITGDAYGNDPIKQARPSRRRMSVDHSQQDSKSDFDLLTGRSFAPMPCRQAWMEDKIVSQQTDSPGYSPKYGLHRSPNAIPPHQPSEQQQQCSQMVEEQRSCFKGANPKKSLLL